MSGTKINAVYVCGGSSGENLLAMNRDIPRFDNTGMPHCFDDRGDSRQIIIQHRWKYNALGDPCKHIRGLADKFILNNTDWGKAFKYREPMTGNRYLYNMSGGNRLMSIWLGIYGGDWKNLPKVIAWWSDILQVRGRVIPVSLDLATVSGMPYHRDAMFSQGQVSSSDSGMIDVTLTTETHIHDDAKRALENADVILFGPGSIWDSVLVPTRVLGFNESIYTGRKRGAKVALITNLTTPVNDHSMSTSDDFVKALAYRVNLATEEPVIDAVFCNDKMPSEPVLKTMRKRGQAPVVFKPSEFARENITSDFTDWSNPVKPVHNKALSQAIERWAIGVKDSKSHSRILTVAV